MTLELAYRTAGSGPPIVLLHAFPLSSAVFEAQLAGLAEHARVIAPDLRGFGDSPGPGGDEPSVELMADDVAALLDRLDIDRCCVAGMSMGGYVTMAMLRRHRERLAAIVLIDTKAGADDPAARENRERIAREVLQNGTRVLRPMINTLLGETTRAGRPGVVARVTAWLDAAAPEAVAWAQRAMAARPGSHDLLRSADVPAFVLVGEEDELTPHDEALAMAEAFPRPAPVYVIPGAGHLSSVENPDAVTGALRDVLRRR